MGASALRRGVSAVRAALTDLSEPGAGTSRREPPHKKTNSTKKRCNSVRLGSIMGCGNIRVGSPGFFSTTNRSLGVGRASHRALGDVAIGVDRALDGTTGVGNLSDSGLVERLHGVMGPKESHRSPLARTS